MLVYFVKDNVQEPCDVAGEVSLNELGLTRCAPVNDVNHLLVAIAELTRR